MASSIDIRDAAAISLLTEVAQSLQLVHSRCGEAYLAYLCTALLPRMGWPPEAAQQLMAHITGACGAGWRGTFACAGAGRCGGTGVAWFRQSAQPEAMQMATGPTPNVRHCHHHLMLCRQRGQGAEGLPQIGVAADQAAAAATTAAAAAAEWHVAASQFFHVCTPVAHYPCYLLAPATCTIICPLSGWPLVAMHRL